MEVIKDQEGIKEQSVKITPEVLQREYLPSLQEVSASVFRGKVAYALTKNYQYAIRVMRKVENTRLELLKAYALKDEKGEMLFEEPSKERPEARSAKFSSEEVKAEFMKAARKLHTETLFDLPVHRIDKEAVQEVEAISPATIIALSPMFWPEKDDFSTEADQEALSSLLPKADKPAEDLDHGIEDRPVHAEQHLGENSEAGQQAEPVRAPAIGGQPRDPDIVLP